MNIPKTRMAKAPRLGSVNLLVLLLFVLVLSFCVFSAAYADQTIELEGCFKFRIPSLYSKFYTGSEWNGNYSQEYNSSDGSTTITIKREYGPLDSTKAGKYVSDYGYGFPNFAVPDTGITIVYGSRETDNFILWLFRFGAEDGSLQYNYTVEIDGRKSSTWGPRNTQEAVDLLLASVKYYHESVTVPEQKASCTAKGHSAYEICWKCSKHVTEPVYTDPDPNVHDWSAAAREFHWSSDYSQASVTFTCQCNTTREVQAVVTSEPGEESTCTDHGYIVHTATVEIQSEIYEDTVNTFKDTAYQELDLKPHDLEKIPAVKPSLIESGNEACWHCKSCQKYFSDKKAENEIPGPVIIPALIPISDASVSMIPDQYYTGKTVKPKFTVSYGGETLAANRDYTVKWKNNKSIGKATVTITGKGAYGGTLKCSFRIILKPAELTSLSAGKKLLTAKWKKIAHVDGYEIQYSLKSSFKGAQKITVTKASTVKAKIKKLTKGKIYYVRIRTYKKIGSKTYYSAWSEPLNQIVK